MAQISMLNIVTNKLEEMKGKVGDKEFWVRHEKILNYFTSRHFTANEAFVEIDKWKKQLESDDKFDILLSIDQAAVDGQCRWTIYDLSAAAPNNSTASESIIIDESKKVQKILCDVFRDNSNLLTLNCWEFEEMIAELLSKQGYKVELTQKTKDNGYDIIALMNIKMHNPLKFLVQCKRYTSMKVGVEVIRSFKEVIDTEKANRGIIVTTSYFTKGALDKQRQIPYLLDYRDKDKVIEWVKDYFCTTGN